MAGNQRSAGGTINLCDACGKQPATRHLTTIAQGKATVQHLCDACLEKACPSIARGGDPADPAHAIAAHFAAHPATPVVIFPAPDKVADSPTARRVAELLIEAIHNKSRVFAPELRVIADIAQALIRTLQHDGTVFLMGNGGSAADAQHFAAELVGRFKMERRGLPAVALTTDTSCLTAVGNDYGFDNIFVRQVEALTRKGDAVIGITTSGNSPNVVKAIEKAKAIGASTIGFSGPKGGRLAELCDLCFKAPGQSTDRIQECHITAIHVLCQIIEETLFGGKTEQAR